MIYQLMCDQLPIVGTLVIIFVFLCQEIPTIGIQQTIVCNAVIGTEKISQADLHITWQKCLKVWGKQTTKQLVVSRNPND